MKKVLIISYNFPPIPTSGTVRIIKLIKYLPRFSWDTVVLTVKKNYYQNSDNSYYKDIPKSTKIYRTFHIEPRAFFKKKQQLIQPKSKILKITKAKSRFYLFLRKIIKFLFIPDDLIFWIPFAVVRGLTIINRKNVDILFASSPPPSTLIIAYILCLLTGKKMVIDLRDEWIYDPFNPSPSKLHFYINKYIAKKIIQKADGITLVTPSINKEIREFSDEQSKTTIIPNGYDPDDYIQISYKTHKKLEIIYTGLFYQHRTPYYFLQALKNLSRNNLIEINDIHVTFCGNINDDTYHKNILLDSFFTNTLTIREPIDHDQNIIQLQQADLLLLVISSQSGIGSYSGKLFEYIAAKRPILALVPPNGLAAEIIMKTRTGFIVEPEDIEKIQKTFKNVYDLWKKKQLSLNSNTQVITNYSREKIAEKLANIFNKVAK